MSPPPPPWTRQAYDSDEEWAWLAIWLALSPRTWAALQRAGCPWDHARWRSVVHTRRWSDRVSAWDAHMGARVLELAEQETLTRAARAMRVQRAGVRYLTVAERDLERLAAQQEASPLPALQPRELDRALRTGAALALSGDDVPETPVTAPTDDLAGLSDDDLQQLRAILERRKID